MAVAERLDKGADVAQREMLDVLNPATQEVIGQIPVATGQDVSAAVERARQAQQAWGALPVKERLRPLRRWLDLLWERQSEGIESLRRENGKTASSAFLEFMTVDNVTQYYIHRAPRLLKPQRRASLFPGIQWSKVFYKPQGVVGIITPWNYPFALPFMDMIPALIAGNAVILKPSEITPFIAAWGVNILHEAGVPPDVAQTVMGDGRTGAALVDQVDYVQFTGSTAVGRKVAVRCAERLIPYTLELGGKDPSIVLADADLDMAAIGLIQGAFENAGQMCISIERVYVEEAIYDSLLERLQHYAASMKVGLEDGMDVSVGSMTNRAELDRTVAHIDDAVTKGAKVIAGGQPRPDIGPLVHEPTILVDVDPSMDIMREETFGPVMPIMKVKNAEEALQHANDTSYGLSASIFSGNLKRAQQLALRIDSGDVSVNRAQYVSGTPALPWGGQGASGTGRRNGPEGLLKYTAMQSILLDTLTGAEKSLVIATPLVVRLIKALRFIRRYVPFI